MNALLLLSRLCENGFSLYFKVELPQNVQHIFFSIIFLVISTGCCYIENRLKRIFWAFSQIFLKFEKNEFFTFVIRNFFTKTYFHEKKSKKHFLKILKYPKKGIFYFEIFLNRIIFFHILKKFLVNLNTLIMKMSFILLPEFILDTQYKI